MRLYELITFTVRVRTPTVALARIEAALAQSLDGVELMGCWLSEIGPQNRIVLLRGFPSEALRQAERERYLLAADALRFWLPRMIPPNCVDWVRLVALLRITPCWPTL